MDFLNKALGQLKDLFGSMTPGTRITAGLLLGVIVISLVYLVRYSTTGPDEYLLGGAPIAPGDMAAMQAAFAQKNLSDYRIEGNRIRIPRTKKAAYHAALADGNALPPDFHVYFDKALENGSMFESRQQRQQRQKNAKQKELSLIIRSMKGIERATMQFDETDEGGFPPKKEFTAMVAAKPVGSEELDPAQVKSIKYLVSSAIAGLKAQNVSVTDLNTGRTVPGGGDGAAGLSEDPYSTRKREYQQQWTKAIANALSYVKGVLVTVNVELNPELRHLEESIKYDAKPVPLTVVDETETVSSTNPGSAGRPGAAAQAMSQASLATSGVESKTEKNRSESTNTTGQDQTRTEKASLVPTRVTASIGVPDTYYLEVWRKRHPTPEGEKPKTPSADELTKIEMEVKKSIEEQVVTVLPAPSAGTDPYPRVTVHSFTRLPAAAEALPTVTEGAVSWLGQHWSTLGMTVLGMFSLLLLRNMVKSSPQPGPPTESEIRPQLSVVSPEEEPPLSEDEAESRRRRRFTTGGPNLRDELAEMVREDPDAAAQILRSWIGEAG